MLLSGIRVILNKLVTVDNAILKKLTNIVPTIEQSGIYPYDPHPI